MDGVPGTASPTRTDLIRRVEEARALRLEWIRRQVVVYGRVDILAREVLGYDVLPHHFRIMQHQARHARNLVLVWRGAGKTTVGTVARTVYHLVRNPNVRILIASKSSANSVDMLSEVKQKLLSPQFVEVFGAYQGDKWDDVQINVAPRTATWKEPNVTAVGVETAVVSKHYDVILGDDLVDEKNARTPGAREQVQTFFYKTLLPCLNPVQDDGLPGELSLLGTRYHDRDLYGFLAEHDMSGPRTLRIPALIGNETDGFRSEWPERFPVQALLDLRTSMGSILFDSQYQLSTDKMRGEVFDYDSIHEVEDADIPENLPKFLGADLAISQSKRAHLFAIVVGAYDRARDLVYVLDYYGGKRTFREQRGLIVDYGRRYRIERGAVENVAYQEAMLQELKAEAPDVNVVPIRPPDDKLTRAWRLSARFSKDRDSARILFRRGLRPLIDQLLMFPRGEYDDGFDALDHMVSATRVRVRKERDEPELW